MHYRKFTSSFRRVFLPTTAMVIALTAAGQVDACTTALWSPQATYDGVPMLWKNRDTDTISNKAVFVAGEPLTYIGLVNAEEISKDQVWAGLNQAGLGIMNSASYNLPMAAKEAQDREGIIMAEILRTCRTVADVENYFKTHLGAKLGSQSNFGVMDGSGNVMLFEVYNHSYSKINVNELGEKYLVNTNFSRSGKLQKGAGYLRFERATALLQPLGRQDITVQMVFALLARDFHDPLLLTPSPHQLEQVSAATPLWSATNYTINREETAAAVVLRGKQPTDPASRAVMWVALGEPLAALAIPLWVEAHSTPAIMHQGKDAPLYIESVRVQKIFRPFIESDKKNYINLARLVNREGTGTYQPLVKAQNEIFLATAAFLKDHPSDAQLAQFSDKMAALALQSLQNIH